MKLLNELYDIIGKNSGDGVLTYQVKFNPDCLIYQSHFPGNPITPGVCLIQMASEILELEYHHTYDLSLLKSIKFKKTVRPGEVMSFIFTDMAQDDDLFKVNVSVENEEAQYAKMALSFREVKHQK